MFLKPDEEVTKFREDLLDWRVLAGYWEGNRERLILTGSILVSSGR